MWDLAGLELTGVYGTWSERSYELADVDTDVLTLIMTAEESPGPDWVHRVPDEFYGESLRWSLTVPRAEVTDVHSTLVQGTVGGVVVDVLAQRFDRSWGVSADDPDGRLAAILTRLGFVPSGSTWTGWVPEKQLEITGRCSYVPWPPQPCC